MCAKRLAPARRPARMGQGTATPNQSAGAGRAMYANDHARNRVDAGYRRQIGRGCCDGLDSRFFGIGDDRYRLDRFLLALAGLFQDLDLAINAQNLRPLLLELGVATFKIVPHLVRLDFLLGENLAHRTLHQVGERFVPGSRCVIAGMACQQPRRP